MNDFAKYIDIYVAVVGSLLGSFKASVEFDRNKSIFVRCIDVALGVFIGVAVAFHFGATFNLWLNGLLAVVSGACGAMVLEVVMQITPSITKQFVKGWINKLK